MYVCMYVIIGLIIVRIVPLSNDPYELCTSAVCQGNTLISSLQGIPFYRENCALKLTWQT